jgi:hypothetical protein
MKAGSIIFVFVGMFLYVGLSGCVESQQATGLAKPDTDMTESLQDSLVYLNVSAYNYEMLQPWRSADVVKKNGYACAVGPYEVLTTSLNVSDATMIEVRRFDQNEYIPAKVKTIDYECNLCLLELDHDSMSKPLVPIRFAEAYEKGGQLDAFWLAADGDVIHGRGYLDHVGVNQSPASFGRFLEYVASDTSSSSGKGRLFCLNSTPVGIACWANTDKQEAGIIPAVTINHFLRDAADGDYRGFGMAGFATQSLIDPTLRRYLGMDADTKHGVHVSNVHRMGTGSDSLQEGDCLLAIDGHEIDSRGRYADPVFDRIAFDHLINTHDIGDMLSLTIFRDGKQQDLQLSVVNFAASQMLVPYYEYGKQPEYIVTGGYVLQKLTRDYLQIWGENWTGKVPPHLYQYYRNHGFDPTDDRKEIVVLSYVLPAPINLGYQQLGRVVVDKINGMKIGRLSDVLEAQKLNPDSRFDVIEFEQDNPTVVIDRSQLGQADQIIAQTYGITKLVHVEP